MHIFTRYQLNNDANYHLCPCRCDWFNHARINAAEKLCIEPGTIGKVTYTQTVRAV
jgi:hypothetical protein